MHQDIQTTVFFSVCEFYLSSQYKQRKYLCRVAIFIHVLLHEKFLQFDWLRAVVFQLNLKHLPLKIINLLRVVV